MNTKKYLIVFGMLLLALGLVACVAPAPADAPAAAPAEGEQIVLQVAYPVWFSDFEWQKGKMEEWDASRDDVTLEILELPSPDGPYREKLVLDLAAGQAADVYLADTFWIGEFQEAGYLADLTDNLNAWDGWDQWFEAAKTAVSYKDGVYGLNRTTDVRPLYYRKDFFEAAGIETPWQPESWADMLAAAQALKDEGIEAPWMLWAGVPGGEGTTMQGFYMAYLGCDGQLWNPDSDQWDVSSQCLQDTFQLYADLYTGEAVGGDPDNWLAGDPVSTYREMMQAGELGMISSWSGEWYRFGDEGGHPLENRDEQLDHAKFPAQEPGKGLRGQDFVTISGGWMYAVNEESENVDAAFDMLAYLLSEENALAYYQELVPRPSGLPTRMDVAESPEWQELADDYMMWQVNELVPLTTYRPPLPTYPKVSEAVQKATEGLLLGESVEDVMADYKADVIRIVGEENVTQ